MAQARDRERVQACAAAIAAATTEAELESAGDRVADLLPRHPAAYWELVGLYFERQAACRSAR